MFALFYGATVPLAFEPPIRPMVAVPVLGPLVVGTDLLFSHGDRWSPLPELVGFGLLCDAALQTAGLVVATLGAIDWVNGKPYVAQEPKSHARSVHVNVGMGSIRLAF